MKKSEINILIVEDDKTMREALSEAIRRKGYRAIPVIKPDEAESIVKIRPVHGLIVDVMLPGKNGVDLIARMKENLLDDVPIILISGIYRDRAFAQEAVRSTGALEYFIKPFNIEELLTKFEKKLVSLETAPKMDMFSLLSTPFASPRDRRKALDHVENISGYDLPFVFCILMESESSGHLNIVDSTQNIYGVTFAKGGISKIDSESTTLTTKKVLLQHGFITELELSELKAKGAQGDLMKALISEGLISPHAPAMIKIETLAKEMSKLITGGSININFVPDRKAPVSFDDVDSLSFLPYLNNIIDTMIDATWLKNFYSKWSEHPIQLGPQISDYQLLAGLPIVSRVPDLISELKKQVTLDDVLASGKFDQVAFYKALHLLMLKRVLVFQEVRRERVSDDYIVRVKSLHAAVKGKDPIQIFKYFGLSDNPKVAEVVRVYKEFAKANHPDTLPVTATQELKTLNHEIFSCVTAAHDTLSNEEKKKKYFDSIKQMEAEKQIRSDDLVTAGVKNLQRGQYTEALKVFTDADQMYSSERSRLHLHWAQLKVDSTNAQGRVDKIEKSIRDMPPETRRSALWIFINALVKKAKGDKRGFIEELQRAHQADPQFAEPRREIMAIKGADQEIKTTQDILTGDISTVFKSLFKKKGA